MKKFLALVILCCGSCCELQAQCSNGRCGSGGSYPQVQQSVQQAVVQPIAVKRPDTSKTVVKAQTKSKECLCDSCLCQNCSCVMVSTHLPQAPEPTVQDDIRELRDLILEMNLRILKLESKK